MSEPADIRVVHLVPPNGGGVDRFVRDLCSRRPSDWLLHVSEEQCVLECGAEEPFIPLATADLAALVGRGELGRAAVLHAHSTVAAVRHATHVLASGMQLPYVITLHDVEFAGGDTAVAADREQRIEFVRAAARCTVPSGFMLQLAARMLGPSFSCVVIENGVDALPRVEGEIGREQFRVAVIGAVGQHKGLGHLIDVANALPAPERLVLIGYADGQLGPGWLPDTKVWVHGAFEPAQLPALVAQYGACVAFFPTGQPESYCYALSDAWLAGLPVVGPDCGAIGERVRAQRGGRLYDPAASASDIALSIKQQLDSGEEGAAHVKAAVASLVSVADMVDQMNAVYAGVAKEATQPHLEALRRAASQHLDGRFFRKELLRLQGDLSAAEAQRDNALQELRSLAGHFEKRGEWIGRLQQAQDELRDAVEALRLERESLQKSGEDMRQEIAAMRVRTQHHEALQAEYAALQESFGMLRARHEAMVQKLTLPLRVLPPAWRAWIVKIAKQAFFAGSGHG